MSDDLVALVARLKCGVATHDDRSNAADLLDSQQDQIEAQAAEITRLRAELATARCNDMGDAWIAQKHAWQEAIEDALLQWCDAPSEDEAPKDALRRLIQHETTAALDPAVSQTAADLVATARRDGMERAVAILRARHRGVEHIREWRESQHCADEIEAAIRAAAGEGKP